MATLSYEIPNDKVDSLTATMVWLWAIPQIENPAYEDGNGEPEYIDEYTDVAWAKEGLRRWIIKQNKRHKDTLIKEQVDIPADDELLT